jgi:threonine dehydrogenase-like Zn-dependent dehydrogenase
MRATCWSGRNTVQVENVPDPKILNDRDAIVKISSTAICGSDLHLYDGYVPTMRQGDILGHEFMGEIVEVGRGVGNLSVGDRVVVPFPIACGNCAQCRAGMFSVCENSNPNAGMAEKLWGHAPGGIYGYSSLTGGYAGGQAEYARVPFADVGPIKIENPDLSDDQVLFLSDVFPTGYMGAEVCEIAPGDVIAIWGAGPIGLLAAASARMLGAERIIVIDRWDYRLDKAREAGATDLIDYGIDNVLETLREMTGGRGPDAWIDCVGLESHHPHPGIYGYDRIKQAARLQTERGFALREAIMACRNGGIVSIMGVYGGSWTSSRSGQS